EHTGEIPRSLHAGGVPQTSTFCDALAITVNGFRYSRSRYRSGMSVSGYRIGARNIKAVVTMPTICLRSRRNTPSDASSQIVPATNGRKQATTTGKKTIVQGTRALTSNEMAISTRVDTSRWNNAAPSVLQERLSSGNTTRLTKFVFSTISVVPRLAHSENSVLMLRPANRMIANWKWPLTWSFQREWKITPNTKV